MTVNCTACETDQANGATEVPTESCSHDRSVTAEATRQAKTALIVEGGGMRGAWACGVLGAMHEIGLDRFDLVVAASSGACSAAYFVAGMCEPALEIWQRYVGGQQLLRITNWLHFKPVLDLAYLIEYLFRNQFPLRVETYRKGKINFQIVLTDCRTGKPVYFPAHDEEVFNALRASSSLPFVTPGFWLVSGKPYTDGAIGDPIPIRHVLDEGATDITVILTHGPSYRMKPVRRLIARLGYPFYPRAAEAWIHRHEKYNAALDLLARPPEGVRIRVLRPMCQLHVDRFSDDPSLLRAAVTMGHDEAYLQLQPNGPPARPKLD